MTSCLVIFPPSNPLRSRSFIRQSLRLFHCLSLIMKRKNYSLMQIGLTLTKGIHHKKGALPRYLCFLGSPIGLYSSCDQRRNQRLNQGRKPREWCITKDEGLFPENQSPNYIVSVGHFNRYRKEKYSRFIIFFFSFYYTRTKVKMPLKQS